MSIINSITTFLSAGVPVALAFILNVIFCIVVFFIGVKVIAWIQQKLSVILAKYKVDMGLGQFLCSFVKIALYVLLVGAIAMRFGLEPASVAVVLGSAGVAIGLALQGSLSNLAGGILILLLKPFKVGDYIVENSAKNEGVVNEIHLFYTKLQTLDNKIIIIPNGILSNSSLVNLTNQQKRRVDFTVSVSYSADLKAVKEILMGVLNGCETVIEKENTLVVVEDLSESTIKVGCKAWTMTDDYWTTRWELIEDVKLALEAAGIEIAYNHLNVVVKDAK